MLDVEVRHVGVFRDAGRYKVQRTDLSLLLFHVRGLTRLVLPAHDLSPPPPCLVLILAGEAHGIAARSRCETWVVQFTCSGLTTAPAPGRVLCRHAGHDVAVPRYVPVREAGVPFWRREFTNLRDDLAAPTPAAMLDAALRCINVIRHLLSVPDSGASPAARMKSLLDDRTCNRRSLKDLSRDCGFSVDHMRLLFRKRFGITPAAYRARKRLSVANDLIASSDLSLKEIAAVAGYRHASHLSADYKRAFGLPPSNAMRRFRQD